MLSEVENIIKSPRFPFIYKELDEHWKLEQNKRQEFYALITEQLKAEFIEGEIIFHSPARNLHILVSDNLHLLISPYVKRKELGRIMHEKCLISLTRNDFEPDIVFFKKEKSEKFKPDQMKHPSPDFVVEILSPSTEKIDREIKFEDYALHEIEEYWIIDPDLKIVEQYILENGKYNINFKANNGIIQSKAIQGFSLFVAALFDEHDWLIEHNRLDSI